METDETGLWAAGDPRSPSTWSGTPLALCEAFERAGVRVVTGSGQTSDQWLKWLYGPLVVAGRGPVRFRHFFGPLHRQNCQAWRQFRLDNPTMQVLHTDHMWLKPEDVGPYDYLFRDSGWSTWANWRGLPPHLVKSIGRNYGEVLRRSGGVFTTSEWAKNELIANGARPQDVHVVGTGVGALITPNEGNKDFSANRLLCIAKVRHFDKGVDILFDAMRILEARGSEAHLDFVGPTEGGEMSPDNVTFHGRLPADELQRLFREATVYVMPARYEPYGLVYLEAMLSRTPVIGSQYCAFPEFAAHGRGVVLEQLEAECLADEIARCLGDPEQARAMGEAGLKYARNYTWDRTVRRICDVIK